LQENAFEHFLDEGLITKVIRPIKSGKEASVHLCRAVPSTTGERLAALKIYHPRERRNFKDTTRYTQGRVISKSMQRGIARGRRAGRELEMGLWIEHEWATLGWLHRHGVRVPRPIALGGSGILMEWVGDEAEPAPQLRSVRLDPDDAHEVFDEILRQVRVMLNCNVIHADLSPYNVLMHDGEPWFIDLPQSVDPREHRGARDILARDVQRICDGFTRAGVRSDPGRIVRDLWSGWMMADLVPEELRDLI
jgi:RIO kinase 1